MMITRIGLLTHTPRKFPCVDHKGKYYD
eukprot:COSAG01_NODE_26925_length_697_cov_1.106667_1_plen_27_part_10